MTRLRPSIHEQYFVSLSETFLLLCFFHCYLVSLSAFSFTCSNTCGTYRSGDQRYLPSIFIFYVFLFVRRDEMVHCIFRVSLQVWVSQSICSYELSLLRLSLVWLDTLCRYYGFILWMLSSAQDFSVLFWSALGYKNLFTNHYYLISDGYSCDPKWRYIDGLFKFLSIHYNNEWVFLFLWISS